MNTLRPYALFLSGLLLMPFSASAVTDTPEQTQVHHPIWLNETYCPVEQSEAVYYLDQFEPTDGGFTVYLNYQATQTKRFQGNVRQLNLCTPEYFGAYQVFYRDGTLLEEGYYNDQGQREGWVHVFDREGRPLRDIPYQDNEVHGLYSTYSEGELVREEEVAHGRRHGANRMYFPSGQLRRDSTFKEGSRHGTLEEWDEDGNLIHQLTYREGRRHGVEKRFFSGSDQAGELRYYGEYNDGQSVGEHRDYYAPGQLRVYRQYNDDSQQTHERRYKEDGTLTYQMEPTDTPHGAGTETREYDPQGDLTRVTLQSFDEDWRLRQRYNEAGDLIERLERLNGLAVNEFVRSGWGGNLQHGQYVEGKMHGDYIAYDNDGEIVNEGTYDMGNQVGRWVERNSSQTIITHYDDEGELHGKRETQRHDGTVILREHYQHGELHGEYTRYEGERKIIHGEYVEGQRQGQWVISPSPRNNYIQQGEFKDGIQVGRWETLNQHGHPLYINQFNERGRQHGRQLTFNANGAIEMLHEFVDGMEHGIRVFYYQGKPSHAERYDDGYFVEDLGNVEDWCVDEHTNCLKQGL